ncbi:hypothetical protein RJ639_047699 [Escallonia herrerae]|uniref:Uncharacterized protein n=1 Tax=Escallonia herrerae TaxID=1293975 RepID=A0AA88W6E8_9ASTE|nr:hypothetical protein RJ639_047699 [Escallonia herrerae]
MPKPSGAIFFFALLFFYASVLGSSVREQGLKRPDPLCNFRAYNGGYDVRNMHYWASTAFTGIHGYAIAGVWMLFGLGLGSYLILKNLNGGSSSAATVYPDSSYPILFSLIALFTFLAIIATSFIIAASRSSLHRTRMLKETIFGAGGDARQTIKTVTLTLRDMQTLLRLYDPKTSQLLNSTIHRLGEESHGIQLFVDKGRRTSEQAIDTLYIANLVVVTTNLIFLVAALVIIRLTDYCFGSVLLFLHWHPGIIIFAEDTCSAFEDFERNPGNSSLKSVLSCAESSYSQKVLVDIGLTVHRFISELNLKVSLLHHLLQLDEGNEDLLGIREICDPFSGAPSYSYEPDTCAKDAISVGDLPNVLSRFTCYKHNSKGNCTRNGRYLPEASYVMAWAYSQSIQDLINVFPDLQSLTQCTSVKQAFHNAVSRQCRPFRASARMLWCSTLALSIIMLVLSFLWVAKAFQDRGRCFSNCSIVPQPH